MKKKILALLMCVVMVIGILPFYAFAEDSDYTWLYKVISEENKTAELSGVIVRSDLYDDEQDIVLPEEIDGYTIIAVSNEFRDNTTGYFSPKSLYMPDTYKRIGEGFCFGCNWLSDLRLPKGLEWIDYGAFDGCDDLWKAVEYDQYRVKYLGEYCFGNYRYSVKDPHPGVVVIRQGTTLIKGQAFSHCDKLKKVIIPEGVRTICTGAFSRCDALKSIVLPSSMTRIEKNAFLTKSLKAIYIPESITYIDDEGIAGIDASLGWNYIPYLPDLTVYGVNGSAAEAYAEKYNLTFVEINEMVNGDVDDDGLITLSDIQKVKNFMDGTVEIDGNSEIIGDMNADQVIDAFDLFEIDRTINA